MRKLLSILFLSALIAPALGVEPGDWLTNFAEAKKKAKAEDKRLLMLFTGSDWCTMCKLWQKEVFTQPEFREYAKTNLVMLLVDFPEKRPLPRAQQRANEKLLDKYKAEEYPEVVVLDSAAKKELARIRYKPGGLERFMKLLNGGKE